MKIKIRSTGDLEIERDGHFMRQYCPFSASAALADSNPQPCGDWCPLFGDPAPVCVGYDENHKMIMSDTPRMLDLCHDKTLIGEIIDERPKA